MFGVRRRFPASAPGIYFVYIPYDCKGCCPGLFMGKRGNWGGTESLSINTIALETGIPGLRGPENFPMLDLN
jgi:hypothetical protein